MKILAITDMDSTGSGYRTVCTPLFDGLAKLGYEIRVAGLMYQGNEHNYPFSIIPAGTVEDAYGIANNLIFMWRPDILIVALDIPLQHQLFSRLSPLLPRTPDEVKEGLTIPRKYIAITPLENGPLTMSWAAQLMPMDSVFFISELGKQEALKAGVSKAEHLVVGVDTESWKPPTSEERKKLRSGLGISEEAFVVLTVADNQERKNLWAGIAAVSQLKKEIGVKEPVKEGHTPSPIRPIKYIMVTREQSPYGWKLRDLAIDYDINQELMIFERGMPIRDLWGLYAVSDVYLQPSKAEGLGLPVLDAMACKIPVVATDTGALTELLDDERGHLVKGYKMGNIHYFRDVWGNSSRYMIDIEHSAHVLRNIAVNEYDYWGNCNRAYDYVKQRTWNVPVHQIDQKIRELLNEQKTTQ